MSSAAKRVTYGIVVGILMAGTTAYAVHDPPTTKPGEADWKAFRDWTTLALALWGAIVSSILALRTFITDRARIKLDARLHCHHFKGGSSVRNIKIYIHNTGRRPVEVTHVFAKRADGHGAWSEQPCYADRAKWPRKIGEGESTSIFSHSADPSEHSGKSRYVRVGIRASDNEYFTSVKGDVEEQYD